MMSAWTRIEEDLRKALRRAGHGERAITDMLAALEPIAAAVARARTSGIDTDICFALLACILDRERRRVAAERSRAKAAAS